MHSVLRSRGVAGQGTQDPGLSLAHKSASCWDAKVPLCLKLHDVDPSAQSLSLFGFPFEDLILLEETLGSTT